jgi:hypothetical protein
MVAHRVQRWHVAIVSVRRSLRLLYRPEYFVARAPLSEQWNHWERCARCLTEDLSGVGFCLCEGGRDGGAEELECAALAEGGKIDLVEGVVIEGDGIAGQGDQVADQAEEAVKLIAVGVDVMAGFAVVRGHGCGGRAGSRIGYQQDR